MKSKTLTQTAALALGVSFSFQAFADMAAIHKRCYEDSLSPAQAIERVEWYQKNYPAEIFQRDQALHQWIREQFHLSVIAHEMGHSMGLRHNFTGSFDALNYLPLPIAPEVIIAKLARLKSRILGDRAGQPAFVQGNPGEHANLSLLAKREKVLFRILIEDVVDHLNSVDQARLHCFQSRIGIVLRYGDTEITDFSGPAQVLGGALPFVSVRPGIGPHMQLLEIDLLDAKVAQAFFCALDDVVVWKDFQDRGVGRCRPDAIFRWNLRRYIHAPKGFPHRLPDQQLAMAIAVRKCRVNEIHA